MTEQPPGIPSVIVVGDQRFADILANCGAQWSVHPAAPTITAMWDSIEAGALPNTPVALIVTDGTGQVVDELESALAVFAPYSTTFIVAADDRAAAAIARARELAPGLGYDPNAPLYPLPAYDLNATLAGIQSALAGRVSWSAPATPAVAPAPPAEPAPAQPAPAAPPRPEPPVSTFVDTSTPGPAPAAPQVSAVAPETPRPPTYTQPAAGTPGYDQASLYPEALAQEMHRGSGKPTGARHPQMTIASMSSKGGSGKSTTAVALAGTIARCSAAAGDPKRVVVVDMDTRDGQIGSLLGQYVPTAINIRIMPVWDAAAVQANLVHDKRLGIDALLAPLRPRNADDVGPDFYRHVLQVLQTTHDVVILDCSVNYLDPLLGVGFSLADEILFVTTLATTSVQGMARSLTEMFSDPAEGGLGIPREKVGIVANQAINNVGMGKDQLLKAALGAPLVGQIPAEHDAVLLATNKNEMWKLIQHPRLGPAYFKLAQTCLPGWRLAPVAGEGGAAAGAAPGGPGGPSGEPAKKKGLFGRG